MTAKTGHNSDPVLKIEFVKPAHSNHIIARKGRTFNVAFENRIRDWGLGNKGQSI
jgi:hypothetical protein